MNSLRQQDRERVIMIDLKLEPQLINEINMYNMHAVILKREKSLNRTYQQLYFQFYDTKHSTSSPGRQGNYAVTNKSILYQHEQHVNI